jgi:hypothetical protein
MVADDTAVPTLEMQGISKTFPGVKALNEVPQRGRVQGLGFQVTGPARRCRFPGRRVARLPGG